MPDNNEILLNETELPGLTVQAGDDSYESLNRGSLPKINDITLIGNKTAEQLGLVSSDDLTTTSSRALQTILGTIMDLIYPVGSILISLRDGNPNTWDGKDSNNQPIQGPWSGTTWDQIPGRFLVGVGANGTNTKAADYLNFTNKNDVGGYITNSLPKHSHLYDTTDIVRANIVSNLGSAISSAIGASGNIISSNTTGASSTSGSSSSGSASLGNHVSSGTITAESPTIGTSTSSATHSHGTPTTSKVKHTHFMTRTEVPEKNRKYGRRRVAGGDKNDYYAQTATADELASTTNTASASPAHNHTFKLPKIYNAGSDVVRSNLPPYLTVYMWKRTS